MFRFLTITFAMLFIASPLHAAEPAVVGDTLPHSLNLKDQNGEVVSFENLMGEKGAVVFFVRSADWCPYCQVQLLDLRDEPAEGITDAGYSIVSVSYDAPEKLERFAKKYKFPYTMLSDEGSEAIKAFGILSDQYDEDHFAYGVPYPTIYVIGKNNIIQAVLSEDGYKTRPQIEAIVETLKELETPGE